MSAGIDLELFSKWLSLPDAHRLTIKNALLKLSPRDARGKSRIDWHGIAAFLSASGADLKEIKLKMVAKNIHQSPPQGAAEYYMPLLYWMCFCTGGDAGEINQTGHEIFKSVFGMSVDDAIRDMRSKYAPTEPPAGSARWHLERTEDDTIDGMLGSFALDDFRQHPPVSGTLGAFLEIYCGNQEIADGVVAAFKSVTISAGITTDAGADVTYHEAFRGGVAASSATAYLKGTRHSAFWEIKESPFINGRVSIEHEPILSLRPLSSEFKFDFAMSVKTTDLHIEAEPSRKVHDNKQAILASLCLASTDDIARRRGRVEVSRQKYAVKAVP